MKVIKCFLHEMCGLKEFNKGKWTKDSKESKSLINCVKDCKLIH